MDAEFVEATASPLISQPTGVRQRVNNGMSSIAGQVKATAGTLAGQAAATTQAYYEKGKESYEKGKEGMRVFEQKVMDRAKIMVADKGAELFDAEAEKQRITLTEDPAMPRCLRPVAKSLWRTMAPHVRDEFLVHLEQLIGLRTKQGDDEEPPPGQEGTSKEGGGGGGGCYGLVRRARASALYALLPFDKTCWAAARSPGWWAWTGAMSCTYLGVSSLSFALLLALVDRGDHYQLVHYVFRFKKFQFWLSGVLALILVAFDYSYCIVVVAPARSSTCGEEGPGGVLGPSVVFACSMAGFLAQILLCWLALWLLRSSVSKGGSVRRGVRLVGDTVTWTEARAREGRGRRGAGAGCVCPQVGRALALTLLDPRAAGGWAPVHRQGALVQPHAWRPSR